MTISVCATVLWKVTPSTVWSGKVAVATSSNAITLSWSSWDWAMLPACISTPARLLASLNEGISPRVKTTMSEMTPATTTVSMRDKARSVLRLLCIPGMVLLLFGGTLAQDEQLRAGVVFHINPPYFRVYKQTLTQSMSAVPVTDGKAVLEFPKSFVDGNRQLTMRFSVKTWSGELPAGVDIEIKV